jgi:hypothetical protein
VIGTCVVGGNVTKNLDMTGCTNRRLGKASTRRVPRAQVERVLELYRERYFDLNVKHFHEKLKPEHQIEVSYTWLKLALQGAGLVNCREKIRSRSRLVLDTKALPRSADDLPYIRAAFLQFVIGHPS